MDTVEPLVDWFTCNGGTIDRAAIGFKDFVDSGRGAVALRDLDEGHTLFTIPRKLLLSTRTWSLEKELGEAAWQSLGTGWASLILCMMWEQSKGKDSVWAPYLDCLPTTFSTPMFWTESELDLLRGTSIPEKIGKEDANKDYRSKITPLLSARPDLFPAQYDDTIFGLENYHRLGSAILSRSFHVEEWKDPTTEADESFGNDSDDEEDETEDTADVAMVPMADMLNARFEHDNARLFYEELAVSMTTTKPIKAGEQIWNTYGDPPNSDLLRRYGHVDLVPLPDGKLGNPADVVEVKADLALSVVESKDDVQERIDWWLENGGDDVFVIEASDPQAPDGLISIIKLLKLEDTQWETVRAKNKPPKPSLDEPSARTVIKVLEKRLTEYPSTLVEDEARLAAPDSVSQLSEHFRNATIVALGEKRILTTLLNSLREAFPDTPPPTTSSKPSKRSTTKRGRQSHGDDEAPKDKKSRTR